MDASVRLDHTLVAVESADAVDVMLELAFPEAPGEGERVPLHVALVLDRSGSMAGAKLDATKVCATHLVRRLRPDDELAVIAYDHEVSLLAGLGHPDPDALAAAIAGIWPGGSTNLSGGWLKGIEELSRTTGDGPRAVVLLTDGQANEGVTDHALLVGMVEGSRAAGHRTSTIGFGADFDEDLLTAMADAGGGNAHFAETPEDAPAIFAEEFDGLASTVAQNVSVEIRPGGDVEVLAFLNGYPPTAVNGGVQLALGDAWGGEHRNVVLRLGIPAVADLGPRTVAELVVRWVDVTGTPTMHERTLPVVVNVARGYEAVDRVVDNGVVEEVLVLEAARAEQDARRRADDGDVDGARTLLLDAAGRLRHAATTSARRHDLLGKAAAMEASGEVLAEGRYDAATSKLLHYRAHRTSRGR